MVQSAHIPQNPLAELQKQAGRHITQAIQKASDKTGVEFSYLIQQAAAESSFNTKAQAKTSSARGLYQFIDSTWLRMVKQHGDKYGLEQYAQHIDENGRVSDQGLKNKILALRDDPKISSFLAAEFAHENARYLEQHLNKDYGDIGATEMYFAHFLGASGATAFLNAHHETPMATAADLFPKAARANRNVFYDRQTGEARTVAGVYDFFAKKFGAANNGTTAPDSVNKTQGPRITNALYSRVVQDPRFARKETVPFSYDTSPSSTGRRYNAAAQNIFSSLWTARSTGSSSLHQLIKGPRPHQTATPGFGNGTPSFFTSLLQNPIDLMTLAGAGQPENKT